MAGTVATGPILIAEGVKFNFFSGRACPQPPIAAVLVYFSIGPTSFKLSPSEPGRYVVVQVTDRLLWGHQYLISPPIYINSIHQLIACNEGLQYLLQL